jgi:hypothetical protein
VIKQAYSEESIQEILTSKENKRGKMPEVFRSTNIANLFHFPFSFTSLRFRIYTKSITVWGYHVSVNLAGVLLMEDFNNMVDYDPSSCLSRSKRY